MPCLILLKLDSSRISQVCTRQSPKGTHLVNVNIVATGWNIVATLSRGTFVVKLHSKGHCSTFSPVLLWTLTTMSHHYHVPKFKFRNHPAHWQFSSLCNNYFLLMIIISNYVHHHRCGDCHHYNQIVSITNHYQWFFSIIIIIVIFSIT